MGRDKALIPIEGTSLIERAVARLAPRFSEVILSTRSSADYPLPGCRVVPDRMTGLGPLHGLACALEASRHELNLVVPCDLPEVPVDFAGRLLRACGEADVAVPCHPDGRLEPLFAVYRRGVLPAIQAALSSGERRVVSFFDRVRVQHVELPAGVTLANLNSPADLEAFSSRPRPQPL